ncbi:hypothetical protein [Sulfuricurvum sp.]|uniref:hypothetical protein n=1 Tax=Sulfuricurvum sp. TaxID=2025608 RepID=UPI0035682784
MEYGKTEDILSSIVDILKHIESVQKDVLELSERSVMTFHTFIEENHLTPDAKTLEGFQYQDIITQQLSAVSEAIGMIEANINVYLHAVKHDQNTLGASIEKLSSKLMKSLQTAKEKQEAFSGNAIDPNHGESIEFF